MNSNSTENVNKNIINSVTSADSWIICDSTSYPGHKFYVNKLSGIKVWNITESEIAFAEKADKNCKEPQKGPKMDHPKDSRIYNKQIINNQFSNSVPVCSPFNVWDNPPLNQTQQLQQTYTLVPTAIAQVYQHLLPLTNNLQNTTLPTPYNVQQYVPNQTPNRRSWSTNYRKNKWYSNKERYVQNQTSQNIFGHNNSDLRKKLVRKKSICESIVSNDQEDDYNMKESSTMNDKNNRNEQGWQETSIQMNLTPLKLLTSSGSDAHQWYIVVDTDVILKNYNYLNNMAAADPDCHLMIPHHVMAELQAHVSESSNVQARRILRFLTQQIECGLAILGAEVAGENATHKIITTCVKLASQNNHVVLISNSPHTFNYKLNTKDIYVYTMPDIKEILANRIPIPKEISPTMAVKITVPNDVRERHLTHHDFPESTSQKSFDSTEPTDTGVYTKIHSAESSKTDSNQSPSKSSLGVQSMKKSSVCSQSSLKDVAKGNLSTDTGAYTSIHSVGNSKADCNLSPPISMVKGRELDKTGVSTLGAHSVENTKADCNLSPPMSMVKRRKLAKTGVSTLGAHSVENSKADCNLSPPMSTIKSRKLAKTGVSTLEVHSVENSKADCNLSPPMSTMNGRKLDKTGVSTLEVHSVEKSKADCNLSPPMSKVKGRKLAKTGVSTLEVHSVENSKADCNLSPPMSTIKGRKLAKTGVSTLEVHSAEKSKADCNLSPSMSKVKDRKLAKTGVSTLDVHSVEKSNADCNLSPISVAKSGYAFSDTGSTKSSPRVHTMKNLKDINRTPKNPTDSSSVCSSSPASGRVSLDTIRMKKIISMKRLVSTERSQKIQTELATNITITKSNVMPQIIQQITSGSRSGSDITSEASVFRKNIGPNVTIEETSTSGVISNSESSHSDKLRSPVKQDVRKVTFKNVVMYKVACQSMVDVLKTRSDEWVFRFVQIMEEILRVKLQEKLPYDDKEYPAPRDLQEAARSIIKKFSNNFNVVDAANKLSFILYKTSDSNGKIAATIQPLDYMEMYSYGVFLVEAFQDMSADCNERDCKKERTNKLKENEEASCSCYEVNTATESLKKLLYDIQNANLETFVDHPLDISTENPNFDYSDHYDYEIDTGEEMQISEVTENPYDPQEEMQCEDDPPILYNLRSQKRKSQNTEEAEVPTKLTNTGKGIETTFFNSLQLRKTFNVDKDPKNTDKQDALKNKVLCYATAHIETTDEQPKKQNLADIKISFSNEELTDTAVSPSKIVRNFTVNADFERRLRERQIEKEYDEEYAESEFDSHGIRLAKENGENNKGTYNESNKKFTRFMGRLARRLGDIFTQVKLLCDEYVDKVQNNRQIDTVTRTELHHKVKMASLVISNIQNSLESISKRNNTDNGKNIQTLLRIANIEDYIPDEKLCLNYRDVIIKCKERAEEFYNNLQSILKMIPG